MTYQEFSLCLSLCDNVWDNLLQPGSKIPMLNYHGPLHVHKWLMAMHNVKYFVMLVPFFRRMTSTGCQVIRHERLKPGIGLACRLGLAMLVTDFFFGFYVYFRH